MLPNKTLEYRLRPEEQAGKAPLAIVVPSLKYLIKINGTSGVSIRSLTLAHTEWELSSRTQESWRDRRLMPPPASGSRITGSGPLPVATQMVEGWKADGLAIDNCTLRNGGAAGVSVMHSRDVSITRSVFADFGASAIELVVANNALVSDCRVRRPGQVWQQGVGVEVAHSTNATVTRCELSEHPSDGVAISGVGLVHNNTLSYSMLHDFGQAGTVSRDANETISGWGGVHTAHPNVTGTASHVHHNVFVNFSSFALGGTSLYFDYGSSGCNASQNLAHNTGSGIFFNSNKEVAGWPGSWQALTDNIFVHDHWNPHDLNTVIHWRTLAPAGSSRRNIFYVTRRANATGDLRLFHDHTATQPTQWDSFDWDWNQYYSEAEPTSVAPFGDTWPFHVNLSAWRLHGKDQHSVIGDPQFVDPLGGNFRLRATSPALHRLGFREWNHTLVGPACKGIGEGSVVC